MDREHNKSKRSKSRSRSPIETHARLMPGSSSNQASSSKRALSSDSEDETKAKIPEHPESTEEPEEDYSGSYELVEPILYWLENPHGFLIYADAVDSFGWIIYTMISHLMLDFSFYQYNLESDSGSLEEIEDSDQDESTDRTSKNKLKGIYKWQRPLDSLNREKKKWLGKDLFSRPWHAKLALYFAKEENGGLTIEELDQLVRIYSRDREPPCWTINARVAELSLEFFNQREKNSTPITKASLYEKLLNLVIKYPSRRF